MHNFELYNLSISSDFPVPECRPSQILESSTPSDIRISYGDLAEVSTPSGSRTFVSDEYVDMEYPEVVFRIRNADEILVDVGEASMARVRQFLLGPVFGVLLTQRGYHVLHGSAVAIDGQAVIFIGPSGRGKSTAAGMFASAGFPILADDLSVLDLDGKSPNIIPGPSVVKLDNGMTEELDAVGHRITAEEDCEKEFRIVDTDQPGLTYPVSSVYLLEEGAECRIDPIEGQEVLVTLVQNTYTIRVQENLSGLGGNLEDCSQVAESVSVNRLTRPPSYDVATELRQLVKADVT